MLRCTRLVAVLALALGLAACGSSKSTTQNDAAVGSDAGTHDSAVAGDTGTANDAGDAAAQTAMKVTYAGADHMVVLSTLTQQTSDAGTHFVLLSDIVLAALPGKDLATVQAGFLASDGYDPSTKSNCVSVVPVPGANFSKGFVDPATFNLTWDAALAYPGCLSVHGLAQVTVTDLGAGRDAGAQDAPVADDTGTANDATNPGDAAAQTGVKVTYAGVDHMVDLSTLTQQSSDAGTAYVLLSDIVLAALPGKDLATVQTGFLGTGGFDPSTRPSCASLIPVAGTNFSKGFVDPATFNLTWDASLSYPGCLSVHGLVQLTVTDVAVGSDAGIQDTAVAGDTGTTNDASNPGDAVAQTGVKVTYLSVDHLVDLSTLTQQTSDAGTHYVLLSDIVLAALPGKDLTTVQTGFLGAGGFDPSTRPSCASLIPVAGTNFTKGFVDPGTFYLTWDASLSYPGCLNVHGLVQLTLTDK